MTDVKEKDEPSFYVLKCDSCELIRRVLNYAMHRCPNCDNTNIRITSEDSGSQEFYNETDII